MSGEQPIYTKVRTLRQAYNNLKYSRASVFYGNEIGVKVAEARINVRMNKRALSDLRVCEDYEIRTTKLALFSFTGKLSKRISVYRGTRLSRNELRKASLFWIRMINIRTMVCNNRRHYRIWDWNGDPGKFKSPFFYRDCWL